MEIFEHINVSIWILQTIAMMITAFLLPGLTVSGPIGALLAVIAIAFVNAHLWDAALFFSIPDQPTLHTAAIFIANGVVFWILVKILPGIDVRGIFPALIAPVLFTLTSIFLNTYAKDIDWSKVWQKTKNGIQSVKEDLQDPEASKSKEPATPTVAQ